MFGEYNAYVFIGDELNLAQFKDTFPQVCIFYADNKFVKATNQGNELNAKLFLNMMNPVLVRKNGCGKDKVWQLKKF